MYSIIKRIFIGTPIASSEEHHQRLGKPTALAVFASDAISSTAYATEEILHVLVPIAAMAALGELVPISLVVMVLLVLVITSYRQTIHAYPQGGGSYIVSRENLGTMPSLVAGASVLVDYVLTVAVSISAGVAAITSAFPDLRGSRVPICLAFLALLTMGNLRGLKESGKIFAGPTYAYVAVLTALIGYGLYRVYFGDLDALPVDEEALRETMEGRLPKGIGVFLLLRAFSSGAVALTGVEAIADGTAAFRPPESKNAAATLTILGGILATAFLGLSVLTHHVAPTVNEHETVLSMLGVAVFGEGSLLYYGLQFSTFAILVLAANTAFADFPRVASFLAADGFLPRQFATRGDRLVFSNGIVVLSGVAALLIVVFGGVTTALIPLYAVGVFTCFTLSQLGMVRFQANHRVGRWRVRQAMNAVGAVTTFIVLCIVTFTKFATGAWVPVVVIPAIVVLLRSIRRHYDNVEAALKVPDDYRARRHQHTVILLVSRVHRGVLDAVSYARSLAPDRLLALSVVHDAEQQRVLEQAWDKFEVPINLRCVYSPYRELSGPVLQFINEIDEEWPDDIVTVVVPEFVLSHWWEQLLHNQSALVLKTRLRLRPNTVVLAVPVHLGAGHTDRY